MLGRRLGEGSVVPYKIWQEAIFPRLERKVKRSSKLPCKPWPKLLSAPEPVAGSFTHQLLLRPLPCPLPSPWPVLRALTAIAHQLGNASESSCTVSTGPEATAVGAKALGSNGNWVEAEGSVAPWTRKTTREERASLESPTVNS